MSPIFPLSLPKTNDAAGAVLLRQTGWRSLPGLPWGSHACLYYDGLEELLEAVAPYFAAGWENNEFCLWVASDPGTAAS